MAGLIVLSKGPAPPELRAVFELYDTDGSGSLEIDEIMCLAMVMAKLRVFQMRAESGEGLALGPVARPRSSSGVPMQCRVKRSVVADIEMEEATRLRNRLTLLDLDGDGRLSPEEWAVGALADPDIAHILGTFIGGEEGEKSERCAVENVQL